MTGSLRNVERFLEPDVATTTNQHRKITVWSSAVVTTRRQGGLFLLWTVAWEVGVDPACTVAHCFGCETRLPPVGLNMSIGWLGDHFCWQLENQHVTC